MVMVQLWYHLYKLNKWNYRGFGINFYTCIKLLILSSLYKIECQEQAFILRAFQTYNELYIYNKTFKPSVDYNKYTLQINYISSFYVILALVDKCCVALILGKCLYILEITQHLNVIFGRVSTYLLIIRQTKHLNVTLIWIFEA